MAEPVPGESVPQNGELGGEQQANPQLPSASKPQSKASAQAAQMRKLREANDKYKNLLKMAKERIQQQGEEMEQLKRTYFRYLMFNVLYFIDILCIFIF